MVNYKVNHIVFFAINYYNLPMYRLYVERKNGFCNEANRVYSEITDFLGINGVKSVRYLNRYDIENVPDSVCKKASDRIFSEPQSDILYEKTFPLKDSETIIAWELLPGQYDQRADSAEQCLTLLMAQESSTANPPKVRCAKLIVLDGNVTLDELKKIQNYLINPVDSRLAKLEIPSTLEMKAENPDDIKIQSGFIKYSKEKLEQYLKEKTLAMDIDDLCFLQDYFNSINRDPTETEIRVLDTYWSDHCRHTTFNTRLEKIEIENGDFKNRFEQSLKNYTDMHTEIYTTSERPLTLMDMAVIGAKYLKKHGKLDDIELSEEINACSIFIDVHCTNTDKNGKQTDSVEKWLLMFKNETHNHPTEIEPFGGAATCIGGAIRDPLSGRSWVYQSMRITGAADPTKPLSQTRPGKLPQLKLTREAAAGFSSYGNQIGLTTGQVQEIYHEGFEAKRMELGAVIAAVPAENVKREEPEPGDVVILVGGGTGRDGIGGATGSSKVHTVESVTTAAAEVQKGNAVEERKIQRLFRNAEIGKMIRRCNDFGAGGVAVAVGELSPGLDINLDAVPKKYEGLNGTELAISESQERMAVVVRAKDTDAFIKAAEKENLNACVIAKVTDTNRLVMKWRGKTIVDIDRTFLDTAGAKKTASAFVASPKKADSPLLKPLKSVNDLFEKRTASVTDAEFLRSLLQADFSDLACCSQRGLGERFDGSIGAASVLFPYGGIYQGTPEIGMAAKIPVYDSNNKNIVKDTDTVSLMTYGYDPYIASWSPWHGAQTAVLDSLAKITALGGNPEKVRLTFQEYFERTTTEKAWGKPVAALLGALEAQKAMGTAAIGGKDSMSGTYQDIHVPPTLVSFAVGITESQLVKGGSFTAPSKCVYLVPQNFTADLAPDFERFKKNAALVYDLHKQGTISAAYVIGAGGIAAAIAKMSFGNKIGFEAGATELKATAQKVAELLSTNNSDDGLRSLFLPLYGSIIIEAEKPYADCDKNGWVLLGHTIEKPELRFGSAGVELSVLEEIWEKPLRKVFPPVSEKAEKAKAAGGAKPLPAFAMEKHQSILTKPVLKASVSSARPKVILPVFPGTNCEYDMERAFRLAGADTELFVFRNNTKEQLAESLSAFRKKVAESQILALSGGFSVGDEPDGSGKFIANVLREHEIADEVMALLEKRKGLVLGICNGFQALIKVGLVPFGRIMEPDEKSPTLTYNTNRYTSRIARTRVLSAISPWAQDASIFDNKIHYVPIAHGEGRIVIEEALAKELFAKGQVFSQYVDENADPTMNEPDNPNGSAYAIEGLTSPDGHVLGKMGHNERTLGAGDLLKNINGCKCQNIFAAGVAYFK